MRYNYIVALLLLSNLLNHSYSQVIDYSTKIYIEDGVKLVQKFYTIRIGSAEDRGAGDIYIRYGNRSEFKLLNAEIIDKNGNIVRSIKKKDIHEVSMRTREAFFQDNRLVKFTLHWHEYPYQIAYSYEEKFTDFLTIAHWYPIVYQNMTTLKSSLELQVPIDYVLNIYSSPELIYSEDTLHEEIRKLSWKTLLYKSPKNEKYAPSMDEGIPHVLIVPEKFKFDIEGYSSSWADFGRWFNELNSDSESLPQSEKAIIDSLLVNVHTKKDTIRELYHFLQDNTNYVNVSIGFGGLKSFPAAYVCQNRYGDCKALTTYMKAILKYVGIKSYYTIINSGLNEARIQATIPSQQFNHVILFVPLEDDTLWLENTSNTLPYDYLSLNNQNRYALLVDSTESKLIKTPTVSPNEIAEMRKFNFHLDKNGSGIVSAQGELRGYAFEKFSYIEKEWDENDKKDAISEYFNLMNFTINDYQIRKTERESHHISLSVQGKVVKQLKDVGDLKVIVPNPFDVPKFEKPEERKQPLRFNYPINQSDSINYNLTNFETYKAQLPDSASINTKFGKFTLHFFKTNNEIKIYRQLIIYAGDYQIDEYPDFFDFVSKIDQLLKKSAIILTPLNNELH